MKNIFVIVGKSGSGKSTLADMVCKRLNISNVVMTTTRPKRENEVDGLDYHFTNNEEFNSMIDANEFVQYTSFRDWNYGVEGRALDNCSSKDIIMVLSPKALLSLAHGISKEEYKIIPVYISCGDRTRLKRGLDRDSDVKELIRRFMADNEDFEGVVDYILEQGGFVIYNDFDSIDYAVDVLEMSIKKYSSEN